MEIQIENRRPPNASHVADVLSRELGFGRYFTDHMFTARWSQEKGWHNAKISAFEDLHLSPAAAVLHYGQALFEGQKAYRQVDDEIAMFRPRMNARRFNQSAQRLVMPTVPEELYLAALERLIDVERDWVPSGAMQSLYVRPFMIATEPLQGVRPANEYLFAIILSPVGAYYSQGFEPVKIFVSRELVRAAPGGTGAAKAAGNYAGSLLAGAQAQAAGCEQVLWLDAVERRYVEEIGAMNVVFVIDGELVTPPLGGSILPGVTRDTVLTVARDRGLTVREAPVALDDLLDAITTKRCTEAFGCGTAAVISAIRSFHVDDREVALTEAPGRIAEQMFRTITDIQWGRGEDPHRWRHMIPRRP
ncbi:MAG: branched-chain amino acid aminotransferase [Myxococcales bacterium FL481]|nr:MAG: branched-chain amino acid aminotransferase [Myxococcales bacterium FL481]